MDGTIIWAMIGMFCMGALLGAGLCWLYLQDQIESRATDLAWHLAEWDRKHRSMTLRDPRLPHDEV